MSNFFVVFTKLRITIFALLCGVWGLNVFLGFQILNQKPTLVAHAGGGIKNTIYTNSLESLNLSYAHGFELIELDFLWTTDDHLVLLHDWKDNFENLFADQNGPISRYEFKSIKMKDGLTPLSLEDLISWLNDHPGVRIVTDVKYENLRALELMTQLDPKFNSHFIPQIYDFIEFEKTRSLGFSDIILTLYKTSLPDEQVIEFCKSNLLFAVTMQTERVLKSQLSVDLKKMGIWTYSHTINEGELKSALQAMGIDGVYTDFLIPSSTSRLLALIRSRWIYD